MVVDGILQVNVLINILVLLVKDERMEIAKRIQAWSVFQYMHEDNNSFKYNMECYERNCPRVKEDCIKTHQPKWEERYYKCFSRDTVRRCKLVHDYMNGIQWVMDYYRGKSVSWGWYYCWDVAPLITDILMLGRNHVFKNIKMFRAVHPFVQLVLVLPRESHTLLAKPLRESIHKLQVCSDFEEITMYKDKRHETIPCLPEMNIANVIRFVRDNL